MRSRIICLLIAIGLLALPAQAQTSAPHPGPVFLPGFHWPVGEELTYRLYWGYLPVGTATVRTEWTTEEGRRLLAIRIRTKSNQVIAKVYPVDDTVESLVEPETFLPVRFTKNLSEGTHRRYETTVFDRTNRTARWTAKLSGRTKTFPIPADIRDIPSLMYYLRSHEFVPGTRPVFKVMADEKVYDVGVKVDSRETLDLPRYKNVRCIKTEPDAAFEGIFVRKGRLWIWISDDKRCLATRIEASIPVANVRAVLWSVTGPGNDRWSVSAKDPSADKHSADEPHSPTPPPDKAPSDGSAESRGLHLDRI